MLRHCKSDPVFLSDNYRSYFVGHLNIVIKILVYSKIINKIFNFTSNFKVGLTHEKFQFVHASCTLIIFFQHFSVLFTREKKCKTEKKLCLNAVLICAHILMYQKWKISYSTELSIILVSLKASVFIQ